MLDVTLLGSGGMLPTKERWLTSCLLSCEGSGIIIDCGEGTQIAVKEAGCRLTTTDLICITHFHADHISGLPGLLLSLGNEGRTAPITIAGPPGLAGIVKSLCVIAPNLPFEVRIKELYSFEPFNSGMLKVTPFQARHSINCYGYSIVLPRRGKFDPRRAREANIPLKYWSHLQNGQTIQEDGKIFTPDMVMGEDRKGLKVTYCTDSRPVRSITENAADADLLICEGLYYLPEKLARAKKTGHMLYSEAAQIALEAGVRRLWLTHFSPAVEYPEEGLAYAKDIFPEAECGYDGKHIDLCYDNGEDGK